MLLLLAEVSEANHDAFIELIVAGNVVLAMNGQALVKPTLDS